MRCNHCQKTTPATGYCCEKAELETLRAVIDQVTAHLDSEVVSAQSIGAIDALEPAVHAVAKLRGARVPVAA